MPKSPINSDSSRVAVDHPRLVMPLPGPWRVLEHYITDNRGHHVAKTTVYHDRQVSEANARLIAAAPELLECLIHLADRDWFQSGMTGEIICGMDAEKVRNALSKVLGHNDERIHGGDETPNPKKTLPAVG